MNTKFEFPYDDVTDNCKQIGLIENKLDDWFYKIYDKEINLIEGERVALGGDFWIVSHKIVYVEENLIQYTLEIE